MNRSEFQQQYHSPPPEILDIVDVPPQPAISPSPSGAWLLFKKRPALWPIAYLAQPELGLAGIRFHPATHILSRQRYCCRLWLERIADQQEHPLYGIPESGPITYVLWSPDSRYLAFTLTHDRGMELWVAEADTGEARCLTDAHLNDTLGAPVSWLPDSQGLLCKLVPTERGQPPENPGLPVGPIVYENAGEIIPPRNHPDMLGSAHDEALFAYYTSSQIARVSLSGEVTRIGAPGLFAKVFASPNGAYLFVETVHWPFSHIVPFYRFPMRLEIWDPQGHLVREIADLPPAEDIPITFGAVRCGPRHLNWRADVPATLYWVEAQDGGDPRQKVEMRDKVFVHSAPFAGDPRPVVSLSYRFQEVVWGHEHLALVSEHWRKTGAQRTWIIDPSNPKAEPRLLWGEEGTGMYGTPMLHWNASGRAVLHTTSDGRGFFYAGKIFAKGQGPGLYRLDQATLEAECVWKAEESGLETPTDILDEQATRLLTWRQAGAEPRNHFLRDLEQGTLTQLTHFVHPTPRFRDVQTRSISYRRSDGIELATVLYLPLGYTPENGPLPAVIWAYPHEQTQAPVVYQPGSSAHPGQGPGFLPVAWNSPLVWLTQGYAVLNGPPMPVVSQEGREPNDTYVEQLVANAEALVAALQQDGAVDPGRIAIGGHSYGASMVASLLAHTDLFCAGIAWSGAYNRTLTPLGFQSEERTLWEVPQVYAALSPLLSAHRIKAPMLLIHGEADSNSGTTPLQSQRFFDALRAHGVVARLVLLPHEDHTYQARESVLHVLWEMAEWLERYVNRQTDLPL
jgi:dipeptidyl aminopeptidase/acylaminoacyl peptidase